MYRKTRTLCENVSLGNNVANVNSFKNRLDKHWHLQELRFNWQAEITGARSRSKVI